jgi:putative ABC transport system substrate-binding protein
MRRRDFISLIGGLAVVWPLAARAQQPAKSMFTVGILWHAANEEEEAPYLGELRRGLRDLGYIEGQNITLVNTYAAEQYDRFAANAISLVGRNVDVIVAVTRPAALAAQAATKSLPIVIVVVPDPVGSGLVASLALPGGNITGLSNMGIDLAAKRVELLNEAVNGLSKIIVLVNPADSNLARMYIEQSKAAADRLKLSIQAIEAKSASELDAAFDAISRSEMTGISINNDAMMLNAGERIAGRAIGLGLPTIGFNHLMAKAGTLISYGPDAPAIFRRSATYVDKILKGVRPANLPVEQPTDYKLVFNLKTAKALGLTLPATLLARADQVIE